MSGRIAKLECFQRSFCRVDSLPSSTALVSKRCYSSQGATPQDVESAKVAVLRRGTGGRSSFNGIVATVFGAPGYVGRTLCNRLGKIGTQIIIPYRGEPYDCQQMKLCGDLGQVLFHPFHLRDEDSIRKVIKYSNVVINLIGRTWDTRNFTIDDANNKGARTIARISKEMGVDRLIHFSQLNASPDPEPLMIENGSEVLRSKWKGEQAVLDEFPNATILRPSAIFGDEDSFIRHYAHVWRRQWHWMPLWKAGDATTKMPVSLGDVCEGVISCIRDPTTKGKTFELIGPSRYVLSELVDWFFKVMCRDESWSYLRYDMKWDPSFLLKIALSDLAPNQPFGLLNWEKLEMDHVTDDPVGYPTLLDLGITRLEPIEEIAPWVLRPYKAYSYHGEDMLTMVTPPNPRTVEQM